MRPCGVVNTVRVTRITVRHLLPERTTSLAGLSSAGKISIGRFFSRDATFLFFDRREKQRDSGTEKIKRKKKGVSDIQIPLLPFLQFVTIFLCATNLFNAMNSYVNSISCSLLRVTVATNCSSVLPLRNVSFFEPTIHHINVI